MSHLYDNAKIPEVISFFLPGIMTSTGLDIYKYFPSEVFPNSFYF